MVDLHVHTYMSDGQHSPEDVVSMAWAKGVGLLAVTDHDAMDGLDEAEAAARRLGVGFVPGIEISAGAVGDGKLHILGYYVDRLDAALLRLNAEFARQREEREDMIYGRLRDKGIIISKERLRRNVKGRIVSRTHFARVLVEDGHAADFADAFDRYLSEPEMDRPKVSPERGIALIREAGGVAVMAHPSSLKMSHADLDDLAGRLAGMGLMGMECHYCSYGREETGRYAAIAEKHGLAVTGGSDFHGERVKPRVEIGTGIDGLLSFTDEGIGETLEKLRGGAGGRSAPKKGFKPIEA